MYHYSESFPYIEKCDLFYYEKMYLKCLTYPALKRVLNLQFSFSYWQSRILREYRQRVQNKNKACGRNKILKHFFYSNNHNDYC